MILFIKRFLLNIFGRVIATDHFSKRFPISIKGVIIVDNKVLLLKNEREEWDLPGGKLDASENLEQCLIREIKEEVNVDIEVLTLHKAWKKKILNQVEVLILVYHCELQDEVENIQISYEHNLSLIHI